MQQFLQRMLEEEVDGVLGRARYERRNGVDAVPGYRNGFGQPRRLSLSNGTIALRRPRVRGLSERFESRLLPAFKRRTEEVGRVLPELYLPGLAQGDFDLALRGLLGDGAPLSAPSIARLKASWQAEYELWKTRVVEDLDVVYLWVDGVYVKAGLEKDKAAILVVLAARQKRAFQAWCTKRGHAEVGRVLDRDWERMVTFYQFPREHWKHLRTSNPVESPFAAVRLRTAAAKRFKKVENATAVIWKTLLIAEKTFRRLDAPELLADVASGFVY